MVSDDLKNQGYDKEAEYFKRQEKEALEKIRQKKAADEAAKPADKPAE